MKLDKTLLDKYNQAVPRYTSYPPANFFTEEKDKDVYSKMIKQSNSTSPQNLAFYIHIPFCKQICYYCGCNAHKMHKNTDVESYIKAVKKEINLIIPLLNKNRKISQIHFGGGTPNAIGAHYLKEIIDLLSANFAFIDKPEIAIECHPALLDFQYIDELSNAGFNRFSLGIQDFNSDVLSSVNRLPSALPVEDLVAYLRSKPSTIGVNLDFIYGLPGQTVDSFSQSIKRAIGIQPDRLVTFSYAHVPWLKKHQEILQKKGLPTSEEKMAIFDKTTALMTNAGYLPIGFDHFAQPNDELSIALSSKQLHRNFQGYCTRRTTGQVYAFGISGISQLECGYFQNTKDIDKYLSFIENDILPIEKSIIINSEQNITKKVINQIMCNQYIHWKSIADESNITINDLKSIVNYNVIKLQEMQDDGLLEFDQHHIAATETGKVLIRNIAALFDPMYKAEENRYSKTV